VTRLSLLVLVLPVWLTQACRGESSRPEEEHTPRSDGALSNTTIRDAGIARDASSDVHDVEPREERQNLLAPSGALPEEERLGNETRNLSLGAGEQWGPPLRVDAKASEHLGFRLALESPTAEVDMEVLAWNGDAAKSIGLTNWGPGFRVLAAFDPFGARTFWVRARGSERRGRVTISRTLIEKGASCSSDCDRLLQLPLPIDAGRQGYDIAKGSVFAYQFGRRELLMALFNAGYRIAEAKIAPFEVKRISRWDGGQPPSHRSHTNGVDVDISLYDANGERVWHPLCANGGDSCVPGTCWNFGGEQMALLIAGFFESDIFAKRTGAAVFLDREFHRDVRTKADGFLEQKRITEDVHALFAAERHILQHVEPHHHHIHIRVDDCRDATGAGIPTTWRFRLTEREED